MSQFSLYFDLGLDHILDMAGFDHIVFIVILCGVYLLYEWSKILVLVTAFTIGHSITLALATFNVVNIDSGMVEFLIPVTIFITAITNLFKRDDGRRGEVKGNYFLALFFGMVHGLGFSNNLRSLLGREENIITQLLAFNLGIEVGQLIIVVCVVLCSFIFVDILNMARRDWKMIISSAGAGIALMLILQNKIW